MNSTLALISGLGLVLGLETSGLGIGLGLEALGLGLGLGLGLETPGLVNIPGMDTGEYCTQGFCNLTVNSGMRIWPLRGLSGRR